MKRVWATNCVHCFSETVQGARWCATCDRLRCDVCGNVYTDTASDVCEWCRCGAEPAWDNYVLAVMSE